MQRTVIISMVLMCVVGWAEEWCDGAVSGRGGAGELWDTEGSSVFSQRHAGLDMGQLLSRDSRPSQQCLTLPTAAYTKSIEQPLWSTCYKIYFYRHFRCWYFYTKFLYIDALSVSSFVLFLWLVELLGLGHFVCLCVNW